MSETVWVIDDDASIRWVLQKALAPEGYEVECFANADDVLNGLEAGGVVPDVLITDIRMPGTDGLKALKWLQKYHPRLPVIVMTAHSDLDAAIASYQGGAFEYLPKPFDIGAVRTAVRSALVVARTHTDSDVAAQESAVSAEIIGSSPAMQEVFRAIGRLSQSSMTVLINGASGTGKERVARVLHRNSQRAKQPLVALNMAAIPRDLIESELFGHERGAFTGANAQRVGRFEQANGGTLFLDEIGDMPLEVQTRLLRVLQEGEFYRVGGTTAIKVDVRIIAATHQDLELRVAEKSFRADLFYRLNVIRIHLPDLAQRPEDIEQLTDYFLVEAAREVGGECKHLDAACRARFVRLPWPGNVRQLENVCRWLTVMVSGTQVHLDDLPPELQLFDAANKGVPRPEMGMEPGDWLVGLRQWAREELEAGHDKLLKQALPEFERVLLQEALKKTAGHRQQAAKLLGWGRNTLTRKLAELDIDE